MTRFVNQKLVPLMLFYGEHPQWVFSSILQNQLTASLLIKYVMVIGVQFYAFIPMGIISSSDFTLMELTVQPANLQLSSLLFSLETTMVSYGRHFLRWFISVSRTTWIHSLCGGKLFNLDENPHWDGSETDEHSVKGTCYFEPLFSDPIVQKSPSQTFPFPPFLKNPSINFSFF